MKNQILIFLLMAVIILSFIIACSEPTENLNSKHSSKEEEEVVPTNVSGIVLNKTTTNLTKGNTEQLAATVLPVTAINKNVKWESYNQNVAVVSSTGLITAINAGEAEITVTTLEGNYIATCRVTVAYNYTTLSLEFTNAGDFVWTAPANITGNATVTLVGGGGNGGYGVWSSDDDDSHCGGGGGAGQIRTLSITLSPNQTVLITVGNSEHTSRISYGVTTYIAAAGSRGENANGSDCGYGGAGYPGGGRGYHNDDDGGPVGGGYGGDNGRGHGEGDHHNPGHNAPANSGGGGGGGGHGDADDPVRAGGSGGTGYVRIVYTIHD